jgi:hypothetical protein
VSSAAPTAAVPPAVTSQPPAPASQTAAITQPVGISQPVRMSQPVAISQPVAVTQPISPLTSADLADRARRREEHQRERLQSALADRRGGRLGSARDAFRALAAENPADKTIRSHLHYAMGRDHHAAGRLAEARAEYARALQWDASFEAARKSLELLAEHRQPPRERGLLSRWFRR